jgi:hypothetical protein
MLLSEFESFLRIAREQKVSAFKVSPAGEMAVQFAPDLDPGPSLVEQPSDNTKGNWKRDRDIVHDPELDRTEWD